MIDLSSVTLGELVAAAAIIAGALMTFIQIAPIKVDPWSALAKAIGRAINGEVLEKVDKLEKEIQSQREENLEFQTKERRIRILQFGDQIRHGTNQSKEHYDQILMDITEYNQYCKDHEDFLNDMTVITSKIIKEKYRENLANNGFLQ